MLRRTIWISSAFAGFCRLVRKLGHDTMPAPITEVDRESDRQPDHQPIPVLFWQGEHQQKADRDSADWHNRPERCAERTFGVWIGFPHDQYGAANDHKREKCPDIYQIREDREWQEACESANKNSGQNRRLPRRPEALVYGSKKRLWKQS